MADRVNRAGDIPVDGDSRAMRLPWPPWRPRCLSCGERGLSDRDLCEACDAALPRIRFACPTCGLPSQASPCGTCRHSPPPLSRVVAPFLYAPPLDRWLPRFKFHHDLAAGRLLSQLMLDACAEAPRPEALVPVPLHRTRLRSRGYDQAFELAKPIARALSLPLCTEFLERTRETSAQSSLHAVDRHRNLREAFASMLPDRTLPAHLALIDDVMTTGSTLHAAADALLAAGAVRIDAWVCARTP